MGEKRLKIADLERGAGITYSAAHSMYHGANKMVRLDVLARVCEFLEVQPGDDPPVPFSFRTTEKLENRIVCHIGRTTEKTNDIINKNKPKRVATFKTPGVNPEMRHPNIKSLNCCKK